MMKLLYVISCLLFYCQASTLTTTEKDPIFSRQVGPKYGKTEMCMGSLISAFYSIPCIQKAFYEEHLGLGTESSYSKLQKGLLKLIVDNFVKMRKNGTTLEMKFDQEEVAFEAVDFKLIGLLKILPKRIQRLFAFNMRAELVKHADTVSVHHVVEERFHKGINVHSNLSSVAECINYQFSDDFTNRVAQQKLKVNFPVEIRNQVESYPEVFTLFLNRIVQTGPNTLESFKNNPFTVDREIVLNYVVYMLIARIEYNTDTGFYSTIALDLGDSKPYRYDENGNVTEYMDAEPSIDTHSVVLFYIPKADSEKLVKAHAAKGTKRAYEEVVEPHIDDVVKVRVVQETPVGYRIEEDNTVTTQETAKSNDVHDAEGTTDTRETITTSQANTIASSAQETTTSTASSQSRECPFYRPNYDLFPSALGHLIAMENRLMSKVGIWPAELLDLYAKVAYKVYQLGTEQYSFKPGPDGQPYYALEIALTCLATNSKVIKNIFELGYSQVDKDSVDYHLAIAIVKMLLGCKNISLERLLAVLRIHVGPAFNITINMSSKDAGFRKAFKSIQYGIRYAIMGIPIKNTIKYYGIKSDDPISIENAKAFYHIKLNDLIEPREASIKGIWYDAIENSNAFFRIRNILRSESEIVVVEVERWIIRGRRKVFNPKSVKLNSVDYECTGVITLGEYAANFGSFFIDNLSSNTVYRSLIPGNESLPYVVYEQNTKYFENACEKESVLLFFSKKSTQVPEKMFSKQIPSAIFKNVLTHLAEELNFDLTK